MRKLLALLLIALAHHAGAVCVPAVGNTSGVPWVECSVIGIPPSPVTVNAIFVNSYTGYGLPYGQWAIVDLKPYGVPADAEGFLIGGIIIITPGSGFDPNGNAIEPGATADLTLRFRRPGDSPPWKYVTWGHYIAQAVDRNAGPGYVIGEGARTNMADLIPLLDGTFEWGWDRSTYGAHPGSASYGINLNVKAYFR